ncbi:MULTISPECIES: hypothetical protein [Burkholderia]|uniref:hypothetical protein n=1 Tax=Burkholderia TaxID=32008 RepID=UPI0007535706|nr:MULTISPECIES: hypothetical protein [Burkholderia]AOJ72856.1 hypothetical protein WS78_29770 [Burkholderia savannae]KVG44913.1 hypothetical protein WS77_06975 [Burkholderia sp. MSMB0265]KVG89900.1 hypothetical protein WS81_19210 [Burkholderia sp. MSMB2040]KVG96038.1 hypothetical protein WS82_02385 [Burkholderia sp. MSMB2041]KVG99665.1 hypothetical protein WS83_24420 [Burkholderia sp. MSMB2042]
MSRVDAARNTRRAAGFRLRHIGRSFGVLSSNRVGTDLRWFKAKGEPSPGKVRATRVSRRSAGSRDDARDAF